MSSPEAIASYVVRCQGIIKGEVPPLRDNPIDVSISVYNTGKREVGCPWLENGKCQASLLLDKKPATCVQLFPEAWDIDLNVLSEPRQLDPIELDENTTFGQAVHRYAKRVGMNQTVLAEFAEISICHVSRIIKGVRRPPKLNSMRKMVIALTLNPIEARDLYRRGGYLLDSEGNPEHRYQPNPMKKRERSEESNQI